MGNVYFFGVLVPGVVVKFVVGLAWNPANGDSCKGGAVAMMVAGGWGFPMEKSTPPISGLLSCISPRARTGAKRYNRETFTVLMGRAHTVGCKRWYLEVTKLEGMQRVPA